MIRYHAIPGKLGPAVQLNSSKPGAGRGHVSQLNYHAIGKGLDLHRAAVQRLVRELLTRLGQHIISNAWLKVCIFGSLTRHATFLARIHLLVPRKNNVCATPCNLTWHDIGLRVNFIFHDSMQVELPGVGCFTRNKGGRVRFAFSSELLAFLEEGTIPPRSSPLPSFRGEIDELEPVAPAHQVIRSHTPLQLQLSGPDSPQKQGVLQLHALCIGTDPKRSGYVKRVLLERWLNRESRHLVSQLSAATVLDLLQANGYGACQSCTACKTWLC